MDRLETARLWLRQWEDSDKQAFYEINSNPEVMRFYPSVLTRKESDELFERLRSLIDRDGFGFWACEFKSTSDLVGFVGIDQPEYELPFGPCTQVGWRLARKFWGQGYATEAARRAVTFGFKELGLKEIVAVAVKENAGSIAVMERIGMVNTQQNFSHPKVEEEHLREHVLYKTSKPVEQERI